MPSNETSFWRTHRTFAWFCCALVLSWSSARVAVGMQGPRTLNIDAGESHVTIEVGKSGAFSFAGHNHEVLAPAVTGTVTFDPADWPRSAVSLQFDASALKVTGKGDPPSDVPKVQQVMLSDQVLDVKRFPVVAFKSRSVSATPRSPTMVDLVIAGDLTLHGQTRPMTLRSTAALDAGGITARGSFPLRQTDFGIQPVTAGGGTVRVKDEVQVEYVLKAKPR